MDSEKICSKCGKQIGSNAAFCPHCGNETALTPGGQNNTGYGSNGGGIAFCRNCGAKLDPNSRFCGKCGSSQTVGGQSRNSYGQQPQNGYGFSRYVGFGEAINLFFKNYFNFAGRASRSEYWWSVLFVVILSLIFALIPIIGIILNILLWIPGLSISIRRLHDIGKPWPWIFMGLIPFVGGIILIVFFVKESEGDNKWGPAYREAQ